MIGRRRSPGPDTVFFLSDYGYADEFVGVVHAVLARRAPHVRVVDLGHGVAPFDVRSGAAMLERAIDHLGPGVVLAVVDPGVGGSRRAVALQAGPSDGPRWFVGPDNGLLLGAAERAGALELAVQLDRPTAGTFDGRDVLAPAVAALCGGQPLAMLGREVDLAGLVRLARPMLFEVGTLGSTAVIAEVTWVDRFGNVQLAARLAEAPDTHVGPTVRVAVVAAQGRERTDAGPVRRVGAFCELGPDELGLLVDANGHLALVVREGSAAERLAVRAGSQIELVW